MSSRSDPRRCPARGCAGCVRAGEDRRARGTAQRRLDERRSGTTASARRDPGSAIAATACAGGSAGSVSNDLVVGEDDDDVRPFVGGVRGRRRPSAAAARTPRRGRRRGGRRAGRRHHARLPHLPDVLAGERARPLERRVVAVRGVGVLRSGRSSIRSSTSRPFARNSRIQLAVRQLELGRASSPSSQISRAACPK